MQKKKKISLSVLIFPHVEQPPTIHLSSHIPVCVWVCCGLSGADGFWDAGIDELSLTDVKMGQDWVGVRGGICSERSQSLELMLFCSAYDP